MLATLGTPEHKEIFEGTTKPLKHLQKETRYFEGIMEAMQKVQIETYASWAKRNDKKCRRFSHYGATSSERWFSITNRKTILQDEGFRLIAGDGIFEDCSRYTENRNVQLSPREAVRELVMDGEYTHVIYWNDPHYYYNVIVWAR